MTETPALRIEAARRHDAGEIMTLQRAAFLADAQIYDNPFMSSLTQGIDEIAALIDDAHVVFLVARLDHRIVGSVRAVRSDAAVEVGRLMTAPDLTGQGIGSRLMDAVEAALDGQAIELHTGARSETNIAFYERRGYRIVATEIDGSGVDPCEHASAGAKTARSRSLDRD